MRIGRSILLLVLSYCAAAVNASDCARRGLARQLTYQVIATYAHSPQAFTQGLLFDSGLLYESTGQYGLSMLQAYRPGEPPVRLHRLSADYFGEGLAMLSDQLVQLTYKAGKALLYRKGDFEPQGEFDYIGEGWGLAYDGQYLLMSNGSAEIVYRDTKDFRVLKTLRVYAGDKPLMRINELEFVDGRLYANIWGEDHIAVIDLASGCVDAWLNLHPLREYLGPYRRIDVLNGIAYNPVSKHFYVTGKWWPKLFEISILPSE